MGWQLGLGIHHIEAGVLHELVVVTGQELVIRATCQQAALPPKAAEAQNETARVKAETLDRHTGQASVEGVTCQQAALPPKAAQGSRGSWKQPGRGGGCATPVQSAGDRKAVGRS